MSSVGFCLKNTFFSFLLLRKYFLPVKWQFLIINTWEMHLCLLAPPSPLIRQPAVLLWLLSTKVSFFFLAAFKMF